MAIANYGYEKKSISHLYPYLYGSAWKEFHQLLRMFLMNKESFDSLTRSMQKAFDHASNFSGIALFEVGNKYRKVWQAGLADEAMRIPHTLDTQFSIASVSKQFTAISLLMALREKGVDLSQALQKTLAFYLPNYDAPWMNKISLHQLLSHTSGLDNYTDFRFRAKVKAMNDGPDARNQHIAFIKTLKQNPAKIGFYHYSNTNYNLLSLVIEEITGEELGGYVTKIIFDPIGMKDTKYFDDSSNDVLKKEGILPNVALGYVLDLRSPKIEKSPCKIYENYGVSAGDGSIVSTVSDLHTWAVELFRNNKVIPKEISSLICQPHVLDPTWTGEGRCWYGYGMGRHDLKNSILNDFWHDGLTYGYTSYLHYFPNLDAIYIQLSNFAENYFISLREIDAVRQQHPNLDESPESEKIIMDALEKRYPGYEERLKRIEPDAINKLRGLL